MKTALATCLVFCLFAADLNGQEFTKDPKDSLEGITAFVVGAYSWDDHQRKYKEDRYIKDLVELTLRKYGIRVVDKQIDLGIARLNLFSSKSLKNSDWETEIHVSQMVQLLNKRAATNKVALHDCVTYTNKDFTDTKQEGVERILTPFLNDYLSVNEKYRNRQVLEPSPTPASNELYPLPSSRRTTEPSKVMQVGGIGG